MDSLSHVVIGAAIGETLLGKKVPKFYSLKEINDALLIHLVSFFHQYPYTYKVSDDLKNIEFKIKK